MHSFDFDVDSDAIYLFVSGDDEVHCFDVEGDAVHSFDFEERHFLIIDNDFIKVQLSNFDDDEKHSSNFEGDILHLFDFEGNSGFPSTSSSIITIFLKIPPTLTNSLFSGVEEDFESFDEFFHTLTTTCILE